MQSGRPYLLLVGLLAVLAIPLSSLLAESIAGRVSGTNGTPIVGAQVIAQSPESSSKKVVTTQADGFFSFDSLPAGSYTITVRHQGFADHVQPNVTIRLGGEPQRFEFRLSSNAEPQLQWGNASRSGDRDVAIPFLFTPHPNDPVGDIHALVTVPSGPWEFEKGEAASGSPWIVSARQMEGSGEAATIELSVSSSGVELPKGLIGYLHFRLSDRESLLPSGLAIGKLSTFPPAVEVVQEPGPTGVRPGLSGDPSFFACCWGE